ncbi:MAG: Gfo/Idh/MocA family oxidoreductase [Clostridia bacterium]|nr:Gfo/Idh/MocA family oxidoreductase [Clostridia bacterium]
MKNLRVGIIGVGNIGGAHAESIFSGRIRGMDLCGLCDAAPEKRQYLAGKYPGIPVFDDGLKLMDSGLVDTLIVATPHYFHPVYAAEALKRGLNVLSEKPAGVGVRAVKEVICAAEQSHGAYGIMFNQRTDPLFRKAKEIIDGGGLGEPKRLVWIITNWYRTQKYYDSGTWRATWNGEGGGVLLNQAPHNLDVWQWLFGMPDAVTAFVTEGKYHNIGVEDDATIYAEYGNGATAVFITTTGEAPGTNRLEISGSLGKIVIEKGVLSYTKLGVSERDFCFRDGSGSSLPPLEEFSFGPYEAVSGHELILANFAASVLEGERLIAPGIDGIRELSISNAAYLSSWTGRTVRLPLDESDVEAFEELLENKRQCERAGEGSGRGDAGSTAGNVCDKDISTGNNYLPRWNVKW